MRATALRKPLTQCLPLTEHRPMKQGTNHETRKHACFISNPPRRASNPTAIRDRPKLGRNHDEDEATLCHHLPANLHLMLRGRDESSATKRDPSTVERPLAQLHKRHTFRPKNVPADGRTARFVHRRLRQRSAIADKVRNAKGTPQANVACPPIASAVKPTWGLLAAR